MKKVGFVLLVFILLFSISNHSEKKVVVNSKKEQEEIRAIYISYIELEKHLNNLGKEEIQEEIQKMVENVHQAGFNWIFLHTRSFSDSIYPSVVFPNAYSILGVDGKEMEVDVLDCFIQNAHTLGIQIHAWVNPYRIRSTTDFSSIAVSNPSFKWIGSNHIKAIEGKGIYYNPASKEVEDLVVRGIEEIVQNYDVDGIHLDDYFYPDKEIDLLNYQEYVEMGGNLSIDKYRLEVVNNLVRRIYGVVHEQKKNLVFGIAPDANVRNDYQENYTDILTWLSHENYVDYIMPQLYYGFQNETKPYIETLNDWHHYIEQDSIFFIPALALYKSGKVDSYAKSGENEWMEHENILARQIDVARNLEHYRGFTLFRYDNYFTPENENMQKEVENLQEILKN